MREPFFAANWKMHKTPAQTREYARTFVPLADKFRERTAVVLAEIASVSERPAASAAERIASVVDDATSESTCPASSACTMCTCGR